MKRNFQAASDPHGHSTGRLTAESIRPRTDAHTFEQPMHVCLVALIGGPKQAKLELPTVRSGHLLIFSYLFPLFRLF